MPRTLRRVLVSAIVTFHAAVMLCGPCLHALPGLGHGVTHGSTAARHPDQTGAKAPHSSADYCPVCHFLSQGQLRVELVVSVSAPAAAESTAPAVSLLVPASAPLAAHPRAPPLAAANLS